MYLPAAFLGLGAVAVWLHVRYPSRRPGSLVRAVLHVLLSFGAFALLPMVFALVLPHVSPRALKLCLGLSVVYPALTYVLLSWVWLLARILHELSGGPRGGLPVRDGAR